MEPSTLKNNKQGRVRGYERFSILRDVPAHGPQDRPMENVVIASICIERPEAADPPPPAKARALSDEWDEGEPEP